MTIQIQISPDNSTMIIQGDITFATVTKLRRLGERYIAKTAGSDFNCDFQGVRHCESVGLALMAAWLRHARQHKKTLKWLNVPRTLIRVAGVTGMQFMLKDFYG